MVKHQICWCQSNLYCLLPYCFPVAICCSAGMAWAEDCQRQLTRHNQIEKELRRKFSCEKSSKPEHQDFLNVQEIVAYFFLGFGKSQQQSLPTCSYFFLCLSQNLRGKLSNNLYDHTCFLPIKSLINCHLSLWCKYILKFKKHFYKYMCFFCLLSAFLSACVS